MTSNRVRRRRRSIALVIGAPVALVAAVFLAKALRLPQDAPLARMYRTEAELTMLVKAVDTYHEAHDAYPVPGEQGLRAATDYLSRNVLYLPDGPPLDGWQRPYRYVPHTHYGAADSGAIPNGGGFCAPESYQIYSVGADGEAGVDNDAARHDNVTSWDEAKPWRDVYQVLQETYHRERKSP